jgi:maltooligosyltrehalose trehalohydrolase
MRSISAEIKHNKTIFRVWAPLKKSMSLHIVAPVEALHSMQKEEEGYWSFALDGIPAGTRYYFVPDEEGDFPDPASPYQPEGVHGPSELIDHEAYEWKDSDWKGLPLQDWIIYEIHTGCFTPDGNFEAIIPRLAELRDTGINAIQLMPVIQFPGTRDWGYDGVYPYAVQNSYGGPRGLKKLVDACHAHGIAVILDVIYNHIGPEGNYLARFGPYFTEKYKTPWGAAINYDDRFCDGVRDFFSGNPLYWFQHYHVDALRCDAVHMMFDTGAYHFWQLTTEKVKQLSKKLERPLYMIAESDLNSPIVLSPVEKAGYDFHAQWLDDFHHALYALIDPKGTERYYDFGSIQQLAKAYTDGFVHSGEWVKFRKRKHGISSAGIPGNRFIAFINNHDQAGNRPGGERLNMLVDFERTKIAAAALLLSPYIPFLFMGEEYAEDTPFYFFTSYSDPGLKKAVQEGRKKEFEDFPSDQTAPDALDEKTFLKSRIHWEKREQGHHKIALEWYKQLIGLRKKYSALQSFDKKYTKMDPVGQSAFILRRISERNDGELIAVFNLSEIKTTIPLPDDLPLCERIMYSRDDQWRNGPDGTKDILPAGISAGVRLEMEALSVAIYVSYNT